MGSIPCPGTERPCVVQQGHKIKTNKTRKTNKSLPKRKKKKSEKRRHCPLKNWMEDALRAHVPRLVSEWQAWEWLLRLADGNGWSPVGGCGPSCPWVEEGHIRGAHERGFVLAALLKGSMHSTKNIIFTPFWTFHFKIYLNFLKKTKWSKRNLVLI